MLNRSRDRNAYPRALICIPPEVDEPAASLATDRQRRGWHQLGRCSILFRHS